MSSGAKPYLRAAILDDRCPRTGVLLALLLPLWGKSPL